MFIQLTSPHRTNITSSVDAVAPALDALIAFERIGSRHRFTRNAQIFAEGDAADYWYKVISGTVRMCKLLADGRRHITEFYFSGDSFGFDTMPQRLLTAEAVGDVIVMCYPRAATERLIDDQPRLARELNALMSRDLANAQFRMLLLGRMSATERVATFLLDMFERRDVTRALDLPMSRYDIADYLGLTVETVSRVLTTLKRDGVIGIPTPQRIELLDRAALEAAGEA